MTDYPDRPGYSFDPGPPPEASRFLRNKGLRPSFAWDDVEPEEHAVAFTAAKMTEIDLVEAARAEVQRALDEGLPFKTFQKNWKDRPALAEWLGKREFTDPETGEVVEVKRSPARRLRVIYDSNLRSARAAGQWERIERTKDAFPYLEYRLGASEVHRPKHAEKAGKIIAVDSPFWDDWMPPNGWGCKCWVRQVTKREAERRGIDATPDVPDVKVENLKTGALAFVPQGIDPGWHRNPGKLRRESMDALLAGKIEELPEAVAKAALKDLAASWQVVRMATESKAVGNVPVALLPAVYAEQAGTALRIVQFSNVTRDHVFTMDKQRRPSDLKWMAHLWSAERVVLQTRPDQHPRLIFEIDAAADAAASDPYERLPLRVYIVVKEAGLFVDTLHRVTARRWERLKDQATSTVLKE